jgi:hypothetical protein
MKDFVFLFRGGLDFTKASSEQLQQVIANWKNWTEELAKCKTDCESTLLRK